MRRLLILMLSLPLAWSVGTLAACSQEARPSSDERDDMRPYTSPPAWKSVEVANFYLRKKKYNAALSRFEEAVKTDPTYAPAYLGLGKVYEKIGLKQKALDAYQKYLDTLPSEKDAEDAKSVRQAIERLERKLKPSRSSAPSMRP